LWRRAANARKPAHAKITVKSGVSRTTGAAAWTRVFPETEQVNQGAVNQGAAQRNQEGIPLDPRAIDRGIPNH